MRMKRICWPRRLKISCIRVYFILFTTVIPAAILCLLILREKRHIEAETPVKKVIILAYPRSGSSFTGSILSSRPNSFYFYEPLKKLPPNDLIRSVKIKDIFTRMFNCRFDNETGRDEDIAKCKNSSMIIAKVVRLQARYLFQWIQENNDVKIIHLVRDPRGIVHSAKSMSGNWLVSHEWYLCKMMKYNIQDFKEMAAANYIQIRYEDLYFNTLAVMEEVFYFLGEPMSAEIENRINLLTRFEEYGEEYLKKEDSRMIANVQFRLNKKWDPNEKWKKGNLYSVRKIEKTCSYSIKALGYEKFQSEVIHEEVPEEPTEKEKRALEIIERLKERQKQNRLKEKEEQAEGRQDKEAQNELTSKKSVKKDNANQDWPDFDMDGSTPKLSNV